MNDIMSKIKEERESEAEKNLELYLDLCQQMDDEETTQKLNDIIGNKKKTLLHKQAEAEKLFFTTLDTQLEKQQGLLDKLSTKHSDLNHLEKEQLKRLEEERNLDEDKIDENLKPLEEEQNLDEDEKSEKKYEYFIIIPNNFKNKQLQPYGTKNSTFFYLTSKDQTNDKVFDPKGHNNIAKLNWFNEKGFYFLNKNDMMPHDKHQIKPSDIEKGYKYVITDCKLSYITAKSLSQMERYCLNTKKTQTQYDVAGLSIVLPYESRLVDLYKTFENGYENNKFVKEEQSSNLKYKIALTARINRSNKLTEEQVEKQIEEQKQKIENNPIQKYSDLIELIATFDEAGLYQLLKATHKTMQKIKTEYGKEFASNIVFFELFLRKTKFYQRFFTDTLNILKEKINQKKQEEAKKIQNNEDTNNKINITNHPENIQLKNDNSIKNVRISEDTDRKLPIIQTQTTQKKIDKEKTTSFKNQQKNRMTALPFIMKDSVKKYHQQKDIVEIWLKYRKAKINKIDNLYKEDDKRNQKSYHALWGLVGRGKKHFSKT